jgi:hypothetical protein
VGEKVLGGGRTSVGRRRSEKVVVGGGVLEREVVYGKGWEKK